MFPQNAEGYQGWEGKELWPRSCTNCMLDGARRSSQNLCMWSWNPWLCSCLPLPILHHSTMIANPVFRPTLNWKTTGFIFSTCNFYIQSFFFFKEKVYNTPIYFWSKHMLKSSLRSCTDRYTVGCRKGKNFYISSRITYPAIQIEFALWASAG